MPKNEEFKKTQEDRPAEKEPAKPQPEPSPIKNYDASKNILSELFPALKDMKVSDKPAEEVKQEVPAPKSLAQRMQELPNIIKDQVEMTQELTGIVNKWGRKLDLPQAVLSSLASVFMGVAIDNDVRAEALDILSMAETIIKKGKHHGNF